MRSSLAFLIVCASVTLSCNDIGQPVVPPTPLNYVPGHIRVGFVDYIRYDSISSFLKGLHLEPLYIDADRPFGVVVQIDSGDIDQLITQLMKDSAVIWANDYHFTGSDPQKSYIQVTFRGSVRAPYALSLIESIAGISWKATYTATQEALLIVEIGQEKNWIETLKTFPIVTWARLDYITEGSF